MGSLTKQTKDNKLVNFRTVLPTSGECEGLFSDLSLVVGDWLGSPLGAFKKSRISTCNQYTYKSHNLGRGVPCFRGGWAL